MAGSRGRQVKKRPTPTDQRGSKTDNVPGDSDDVDDGPDEDCQVDVGVEAGEAEDEGEDEDDIDAGDDDKEAVSAASDDRREVAGDEGEGLVVKEMMMMPCAGRRLTD